MTVSAYYNKRCFNNKLNKESKARFFGVTLVFLPCFYYHSDSNSLKEIITAKHHVYLRYLPCGNFATSRQLSFNKNSNESQIDFIK